MRRNLLICVFLVAVLVEPSFSTLECWGKIVRFVQIVRDKLANPFGLPSTPNESSTTVPSCIVPEPPNGARIVGASPGQIVASFFRLTYRCIDGYVMSGSSISTCSDGVWHNTPTCLRVLPTKARSCTVPEPPNGARIVGASPGQIVASSFRLTYRCIDGYSISGSEISTCSDGVWHNTPTCLPSQTAKVPKDVDFIYSY